MTFNSWIYWVFLPLVWVGSRVLGGRARTGWLLVASYVFYGWWDWRFCGLVALSTVVDWAVALTLDARAHDGTFVLTERARRRVLAVSVVANLGFLGFFKYFGFFVDNAVAALALMGLDATRPTLEVVLPVGISFYTFQTLSYTIDVYRGDLRATRNLLDFATFVAFFPQLVAGPIVRASEFLPQVERPARADRDALASGLVLIAWGLFKKVVVADNLARIVDVVYAADPSTPRTGPLVVVATWAFAWQIYCDFSGYTDIARGSARLFGYEFNLNFDLPYAATDPSDFWRRWHISLSTWLRDYLYVPLGGNRHGPARTYLNLMITMVLGGLWHGAAWTFVAWGVYQGLLLVIHRWLREHLPLPEAVARSPLWQLVRWIGFFQLVCLGWMLFRAPNLATVGSLLGALAIPGLGSAVGPLWSLMVLVAPVAVYEVLQYTRGPYVLRTFPAWARGAVYASWLVGIAWFGVFEGSEFIYFQF